MRIVHLAPSLNPAQGGPPAAAMGMATAQARMGHGVSIVSTFEPGIEAMIEERYSSFPNFKDVPIRLVPHGSRLSRVRGTEAQRELREAFAGAEFVHLHSVWEPIVRSAARAAGALRLPFAITPHGMLTTWALGRKSMKKRIALALGYQRMLENAKFIHMIGQAELDATRAQGFRARLEMVPLGIRADEFEPLPPAGSFRNSHPRIKGRPYVVFLSRLHPGKGLDLLAKAFASIAPRHRDLMLVVIGPDYGAQHELERIIADAGLTERVVLTGPLYGREKVAALCDAQLFCMPSEHEACSVAILESLICGVPVVISPQCDRPEVEQVGAGQIVAREVEPIARAIESIIIDPSLRQSMSRAARDLALSRFTWDRVTSEIVGLYQGH